MDGRKTRNHAETENRIHEVYTLRGGTSRKKGRVDLRVGSEQEKEQVKI